MTDKEIDALKHRINVKAWKARNPEKVKAYKRSAYLRRKARLKQAKPTTPSPNTMPKTQAVQSVITVNARPLRLCRPVRPDFAKRLAEQHPRLLALNAAGKSQKDAAEALAISVPLLRNWLELLGIKWTNVQPRAPYSLR